MAGAGSRQKGRKSLQFPMWEAEIQLFEHYLLLFKVSICRQLKLGVELGTESTDSSMEYRNPNQSWTAKLNGASRTNVEDTGHACLVPQGSNLMETQVFGWSERQWQWPSFQLFSFFPTQSFQWLKQPPRAEYAAQLALMPGVYLSWFCIVIVKALKLDNC